MVADGKWFEWTLFLTILYIVRLCDGSDYCKHYVACQQRLELEERQCVRLKNSNKKYQNKTECLMLIDEARAAVDGLQLRKTELEKDCAMRNSGGDSLGLTYFQRVQCERAIERLLSKMPSSEFIYKFSNEYVKHEDLKGCRKSTKLLRRYCRALSQCCTPHNCSGVGTIQSQISSETGRLRRIKSKCLKRKRLMHRRQI